MRGTRDFFEDESSTVRKSFARASLVSKKPGESRVFSSDERGSRRRRRAYKSGCGSRACVCIEMNTVTTGGGGGGGGGAQPNANG